MMRYVVGLGALLAIALAIKVLREARLRRRALSALSVVSGEDSIPEPRAALGAVLRDHSVLIAVLGGGITLTSGWLFGLPIPMIFAVTVVVVIACHVIANAIFDRRAFRMEEELADAIDLMVSSLRSGVGMLDALEIAVQETRGRFRDLLDETLQRIKYGDSPAVALAGMGQRVPLESYWLFSMTQRVHWEVGGAVARNLAAVGAFVRDRLEMRRIIIAQSTQARISMLFVAVLTYLIGALVWKSNPPRMEEFLSSQTGLLFVSITVTLQALGAFWITRLSRMSS